MKSIPTHETIAGTSYLRLRSLARGQGRPTAELLQIYALEGFLARMARSPQRNRLVLKGGVLLAAFDARRPTRDIDLLALRTSKEVEAVRDLISGIASESCDDGLVFDLQRIDAQPIREGDSYPGVRVAMHATLATANLVFHVDVNVGDPVWPAPMDVNIPRLLSTEPIVVLGYPLTMVIAEKVVTAIQRGSANTRWRDFADVIVLSRAHAVVGEELQRALAEVAGFRMTPLTPLRDVLAGFAPVAQSRWRTWLRRQGLDASLPEEFVLALSSVIAFADPAIERSAEGTRWNPTTTTWEVIPSMQDPRGSP